MALRRTLLLAAWLPCRLVFVCLWQLAYPVGLAQAWLAKEFRATYH